MIKRILFPVDFSPSCIAMAPYVKRAADIFGAQLTLVHVFELMGRDGFELAVRPPSEVTEDHKILVRGKLDSFLATELPSERCSRMLSPGDAATQITQVARAGEFDLIVMPTHAGLFRRMLLGSTTAKVLDDADCPVLTSQHAQTIAPRPLEHREWLCAISLGANSERVLRLASETAAAAQATLTLIHVIPYHHPAPSDQSDLTERAQPAEKGEVLRRLEELQTAAGSDAAIRIAYGPVKEALLRAVQQSDADVLMIERSPQHGALGRMRDLTYALVRESPCQY
jgi:nucleotide-binding universal stress UspA family protein